jgi:hypothetical protein
MRLFAFGLFLLAAAPALAGDSGRYAFEPAENGVFRLDTETGEVALCTARGDALVCLRSPTEESGADAGKPDRMITLEARISVLEADARSRRASRDSETLGRVKALAERMMGRLVALVREMKGEPREAL